MDKELRSGLRMLILMLVAGGIYYGVSLRLEYDRINIMKQELVSSYGK